MKILVVLTSHDQLGNTGRKTGFWLEELAAPYYVFKDEGVAIVLASPNGGKPPLDPKSNEPDFQTDQTRRFEADSAAMAALESTATLKDVVGDEFDAVFYADCNRSQLLFSSWSTQQQIRRAPGLETIPVPGGLIAAITR